MTREEKKALEKINEANLRVALMERSGAIERGVLLSEITGRGRLDVGALMEEGKDYSGPSGAWKVEVHHILGRNKPKGFKSLHPTIQEFWPHIPPFCLFLTTAEHEHAGRNGKMMRPLLLAWNLLRYGDIMWQGRHYWEWLLEEPAVGWLRELEQFILPQITIREWM